MSRARRPTPAWASLLALLGLLVGAPPSPGRAAEPPYRIEVFDRATGRGVPLVELVTTSSLRYVTDSAGIVAFDEPGLLGRRVWFTVTSHGYVCPKDGFGFAGAALDTVPGGSGRIGIDRVNVAERLYRVTGEGIYRDTVLTGGKPPLDEPLLNGLVTGQDSVLSIVYKGRILWFWGDTNRLAYPLGNFSTTGAWSPLPGAGGLDPAVGINLRYFTGPDGFARRMCPIEGPGPVWLDGVTTVRDGDGERLICHYQRMKDLGTRLEHGIALWDEASETFVKQSELAADAPLHPRGHPLLVRSGGADFAIFAAPWPDMRVRATLGEALEPARYEGFTCRPRATAAEPRPRRVERDAAGKVVWGWKPGTPPLTHDEQQELVKAGALREDETLMQLRDVDSGDAVRPAGGSMAGSVAWNPHRRRWLWIFHQAWGTSMLGEAWMAAADSPTGPWGYARKIVTHEDYSFYNVRHHPFLDQREGRLLYFEGTYTASFSGTKVPTPRYEYNQVMYRLDLDDPRLELPVSVYRWRNADGRLAHGTLPAAREAGVWPARVEAAPFLALPPDTRRAGAIALGVPTAFRGLPDEAGEVKSPHVQVWELVNAATGERDYATSAEPRVGWTRSAKPLCRVWKNPTSLLPLTDAEPAGR